PQPYGVEIPDGLEWGAGKKPLPMWIWLHGRGDTATDIHFIARQMKGKSCPFNPAGTIVVEPFGRYCNGWKAAGEIDVLECKSDATARFNADCNRIALAGFSMGGAGAWQLGAHYADQWAVVHTGAGFVDVKRYQKLTPDKMPPWYEQKLWGVYDVPDYARNFLNVPLISYSGEIDAQRDSAEYMTEVLAKEGITRPHLIGPGMGHKYHPETIKEVQRLIEAAVARGRNPMPKEVHLQTRCTRYGKMFWVQIAGMKKLWEEARVDAEIDDDRRVVRVKTANVSVLAFVFSEMPKGRPDPDTYEFIIDGVPIHHNGNQGYAWQRATEEDSQETWVPAGRNQLTGSKGWGDDGLIDEAYMKQFIVVLPDRPCASPEVDRWVNEESARFIKRWRGLMRGDAIVKKASELTPNDRGICCYWGDFTGNSALAKFATHFPFEWSASKLKMAGREFDGGTHVPVMSFGWRERNEESRLTLNSGLTFREAHDKTNSLQNPKLPDWAILDITQPPNDESAGKVVAADFFDEHWQVKK
ncbi:MAG: prolyl oligopeptidase family serine peptidase, partial [Verrucomicrobiaceae bacterium]